jgi:hypothetical protein
MKSEKKLVFETILFTILWIATAVALYFIVKF